MHAINPETGSQDIVKDTLPSILVIAYGCEPDATSEPGVGWNFVRQIARFSKVWVITRANNMPRIDKALQNEPDYMRNHVNWIYIDVNPLTKLKNKIPLGVQIYYALWQWKAMVHGRRLVHKQHIELCHHLTYGVMWLSPVTAFITQPFIWGPIGGGDVMPWKFRRRESPVSIFQETFYAILSKTISRLSPVAVIVRHRASAIIFRTRSTESLYPKTPGIKRHIVCETAIDRIKRTGNRPDSGPIHAICVGRLEYWKGIRYAVNGFHRYLLNGGQGTLTILGDGPQIEELTRYCRQHGLEQSILLPGRVPRGKVQEAMESADIMLHPSFRDGGSWAILEAMNLGIPVICLNRSGPADMVDDKNGVLIDTITPDQVAHDIGKAILDLENQPGLLSDMKRGALSRVEDAYRWPQRGKQIKQIYSDFMEMPDTER